jgi:hypothetical protein
LLKAKAGAPTPGGRRGKHAEAMTVARDMPPGVWPELALAIVSQQAGDRAAADAALRTAIANQS